MASEFPYIDADNDNRSAQVITIDSGKHLNVVVTCAVLCTITVVGTFWAWKEAYNASTEVRVMQYYLQDPNSRTPDEMASWAKFVHEHRKD